MSISYRAGTFLTVAMAAALSVSTALPARADGLTVFDGAGQWRGSGGIVRERSRLLVIWYRPTGRSEADIEAIRAAYKQRFAQESVLRADGVSCVSF